MLKTLAPAGLFTLASLFATAHAQTVAGCNTFNTQNKYAVCTVPFIHQQGHDPQQQPGDPAPRQLWCTNGDSNIVLRIDGRDATTLRPVCVELYETVQRNGNIMIEASFRPVQELETSEAPTSDAKNFLRDAQVSIDLRSMDLTRVVASGGIGMIYRSCYNTPKDLHTDSLRFDTGQAFHILGTSDEGWLHVSFAGGQHC